MNLEEKKKSVPFTLFHGELLTSPCPPPALTKNSGQKGPPLVSGCHEPERHELPLCQMLRKGTLGTPLFPPRFPRAPSWLGCFSLDSRLGAPPSCVAVSASQSRGELLCRRRLFEHLRALLSPEAKHLRDQMYSFSTNEMTHF